MAGKKSGDKATRTKHSAKKQEYLDAIAGAPIYGELISSDASGPHNVNAVRTALKVADLDEKLCKDFLYSQAFNRAAKELADERLLELFREDGSRRIYQLTKKFFEKEEIKYQDDCKIALDVDTGKIEPVVHSKKVGTEYEKVANEAAQKAREALQKALETRTTNDVTKICRAYLDENSDLIPGHRGGYYFVPFNQLPFAEKIEKFLNALGGKLERWPIAKGSASGDRTLESSVESYFSKTSEELEEAVDEFGTDTRADVLDRTAERIKKLRAKMEGWALFFGDQRDRFLKRNDEVEQKLLATLATVATVKAERIANGQSAGGFTIQRHTLFEHPVTAVLRWMGQQGWKMQEAEAVLGSYGMKQKENTFRAQLASGRRGNDGPHGTIPELAPKAQKELTARRNKFLKGTLVADPVETNGHAEPQVDGVEEATALLKQAAEELKAEETKLDAPAA